MAEPRQEIHGLSHVIKMAMIADDNPGQQVTVTDDGSYVRLTMSTSSYPARLTPDEAIYLANKLTNSAKKADVVKKTEGVHG